MIPGVQSLAKEVSVAPSPLEPRNRFHALTNEEHEETSDENVTCEDLKNLPRKTSLAYVRPPTLNPLNLRSLTLNLLNLRSLTLNQLNLSPLNL